MSEILRNTSVVWSLGHTLVLFLLLFESRYSRKKTIILTLVTMIPLIAANLLLALTMSVNNFFILMLLTLSLPSFIVFWVLAKNRDGRFFFTFCMVDTVVLEVIYITQIGNHFLTPNSNLFMFLSRLVILPILDLIVIKFLRTKYLEVQRHTKKGWGVYTIIGLVFYVTITLQMNYPSSVTEHPPHYPVLILLFILMPSIYVMIFSTIMHQNRMHEVNEQENILQLQVNNMTSRVSELAAADAKFRMERHNFRHKLQTIARMVENEQFEELRELVLEYNEAIRETQVKKYTQSAVIDAVLSAYIRQAESKGIKVTAAIAFPDPIPVSETELATVFANAIENAINACEKIEESRRHIDIKVLNSPVFMIQISNSFNGVVEFDENNIPVNRQEEHGFGTRSIAAFCEKNNAFYQFKVKGDLFSLRISFS